MNAPADTLHPRVLLIGAIKNVHRIAYSVNIFI